MDPVVHFEMGAHEKKRMMAFYQKVFGWRTQQLGKDMGEYVLATTTEIDENQMPKTPGQINGGFYQKTEDPGSHAPSIVIQVKDIKASMKKVVESGGKILGSMSQDGKHTMEPQEIPGVGLWISFQDTEGNRVSMIQPVQRQ